jgi:hypothetical protein
MAVVARPEHVGLIMPAAVPPLPTVPAKMPLHRQVLLPR